MSSRITRHCDRDGCITHAADGLAQMAGFIAVMWDGSKLDYCSVDCLLVDLAQRAPLTTVHADAAEERP